MVNKDIPANRHYAAQKQAEALRPILNELADMSDKELAEELNQGVSKRPGGMARHNGCRTATTSSSPCGIEPIAPEPVGQRSLSKPGIAPSHQRWWSRPPLGALM